MKHAVPACPPDCQVYHTVEDIASLCRATTRTIYRWMKAGLKFSDRTGSRRIQHGWLREFMESSSSTAVEDAQPRISRGSAGPKPVQQLVRRQMAGGAA